MVPWFDRIVRRSAKDAEPNDVRVLSLSRHLLINPSGPVAQKLAEGIADLAPAVQVEAPEATIRELEALHAHVGAAQAEEVTALAVSFHEALSTLAEHMRDGIAADEHTVDDLQVLGSTLQKVSRIDDIATIRTVLQDQTVKLTKVIRRQMDHQENLRESYKKAVQTLEEKLGEAESSMRTDPLTRLGNRTAYDYFVHAAHAKSLAGSPSVLAVLDADGFKAVNDKFGHTEGDRALAAIADRLRDVVANGAFVARLGGDEFAVIQRGTEKTLGDSLAKADQRLRNRPVLAKNGQELPLGLSYGVVSLGLFANPVDAFVEADHRMYISKEQRKKKRSA